MDEGQYIPDGVGFRVAPAPRARSRSRRRSRSKARTAPSVKQQPVDIEAGGGKHKTEIGCQDCQPATAPSKNNIPQCSGCRDGSGDCELSGTARLPRDPRGPKKISFDDSREGDT